MIHPSQFLALGRLATLIIAAYADGADKSDVDAQYNAIRQLLLLSKPLQQSPLLQQGILGRKFEEMAFYLAYISREQFTPQQYRELVNLLNESSNWCPPSKVVGDTFLEWQLVTRGWREAVSLATAPPFDLTDSHDEAEKEHACLRGTLICELSLQQFQNDRSQPAPDLEALVPEYLDALPVDPFSKGAFTYHTPNDIDPRRFVCSVGWDQTRDDEKGTQYPYPFKDDISIAKCVWAEGRYHRIDPLPNFDLPWELAERQREADALLSEPESESPAGDDNGI
jgi:hypothetical protein